MRQILHILTVYDDQFAQDILLAQKLQPEVDVKVVDLTEDEPDYKALVTEIFAADSIHVW